MFERFTDRARRVVVLAQEEARMLNHNYIGTEHLLLGLLREDEGVAARALTSLGVSLDEVREQASGEGTDILWYDSGDDTPLAAGMVVSNEPGLYVPGHAGYRISDSMLVTETGGPRMDG